MTIFKAYDIRGVYPTELNEEIAYRIARSFVLFIQKDKPISSVSETIVIGRDMRTSSPQLADAIINGLTAQGAHIIDIGLVATPTFYFEVANSRHRGGIMITASHNPKEYNGLKMVKENAINLSIEEMQWVNEHMDDTCPAEKGKIKVKHTSLTEQIRHDVTYVTNSIKKFLVVADAANSMGALIIRELFKYLPCKLIELNFELDGTFPAHPADPLADENLTALKQKVIAEKADIGIATDGDGDRIFFVDDKGETVPQAVMRGLIAQSFLKDGQEKICYDIRPGKITEEMIRAAGGIPIKTKVGHTNIKETMRKENAIFAGESSGHFFVRTRHGSYEAPMIVFLKLLERMSEENRPLSDIIASYKKYWNSSELNFHIEKKEEIMKKIEKYFHDGKIEKMDGISIEYKNFWFNVRASNTEPLLRLNLEAVNKTIGEEKVREIKKIIQS